MVLLEHDRVADDRLGDRTANSRTVARRERLPRRTTRPQARHRPDRAGGGVQPIVGDVREQRASGVAPTGGERTTGRHEHPSVAVADHARQERRHPADVGDPVEQLAVELLAAVARPVADDPVENFIGALHSDVPDWADAHDKYIGESLRLEMQEGDKD